MDYSSSVLKNHKIPIHLLRQGYGGQSKQSKFKDSDRYYRGAIIRFLLQKQELSLYEIEEHFSHQKTPISEERLQKIILGLIKDKLIYQDKRNIFCL